MFLRSGGSSGVKTLVGSRLPHRSRPVPRHLGGRALIGLLRLIPLLGFLSATLVAPLDSAAARRWPTGTELLGVQNIEGVILVKARMLGLRGRDTTGLLVLDTGAGFLSLDGHAAVDLGLSDSLSDSQIGLSDRALPRLEVGGLQIDQVTPVLTLDVSLVGRLTDRPVLGLLGQRVLVGRTVLIDYVNQTVALIAAYPEGAGKRDSVRTPRGGGPERSPAELTEDIADSRARLTGLLSPHARPVPFRLAGDGKMLVRARVSNPGPPHFSVWLTLIVDTGATKCVLFDEALSDLVPGSRSWTALRGLSATTLMGASNARLVRIPTIELEAPQRVACPDVDAALMKSEISGVLSRAVAEPVQGLLGYSSLRHYDVAIDYRSGILWLDPLKKPADDRPYEYSQVGLQLERRGETLRVMAVAEDSPAAVAGIAVGDELTAIDGQPTAQSGIIAMTRRLEGRPGTRVEITIRRGSTERAYTLVRRRLL